MREYKLRKLEDYLLDFGIWQFMIIFILIIMKDYLFAGILSFKASKYLRENCQIYLNTVI